MADKIDLTVAAQSPFMIPDCGCGDKECLGPEPVPWLSWKHCFKFFEFRFGFVPLNRDGGAATNAGRIEIRIRYEHALCLMGRKQGPIVHSLTLLPREESISLRRGPNDRTANGSRMWTIRPSAAA